MTKLDRPEDILDLLENTERTGQKDQFIATCPAHSDTNPSLSVRLKDDKVLVDCKAGCPPGAVVNALGLDMSDLSFNSHGEINQKKHSPDIVETYDYKDKNGNRIFQVCRKSNKDFLFRRKVNGDWVWSLKNEDGEYGVKPVLYHLPEVLKAKDHGERVFVVEGEKDADNLQELGLVATCNPMGAGLWRDIHTETLTGARVVIIPDADEEGMEHGRAVAHELISVAASLKLIEPEKLGFDAQKDHGKDISDWLKGEHDKEELLQIVEDTGLWENKAKGDQSSFEEFSEVNEQEPNKGGRQAEYIELVKDIESEELEGIPEFPKEAVNIGAIGKYVNWLDENTEVTPSFAFAAFRNLLGLAVGRKYVIKYGNDPHAPIFFDVLIGKTALSRKSNAIKTAHKIIDDTLHTDQEDEDFKTIRGVGSAEGMLDAIQASKERVSGKYAKATILLDEFSTITDKLQQSATQGLSSRIIELWDLKPSVENITRNDPITIERPTASILAGSTAENIRDEIKARTKKGGFFNRFCWWTTQGTEPVPFRDPMPEQIKNEVKIKTRDVVDRAEKREKKVWQNLTTEKAEKLWEKFYFDFRAIENSDNGEESTKTFAIARQPEQTVRHALLFSLFHEEESITKEDLLRAIEVTNYLKKTAFFVLGKFERKETSSCQRRILKLLRNEGKIQKSELSSNAASYCDNGVAKIDKLLDDLESLGHIERTKS